MRLLIVKYMLTALIVVVVSEFARRSEKFGALIGALPLVTLLVLMWMYIDQQPSAKLANYARYTFWYVLPSLPAFWVFAEGLQRWNFWIAAFAAAVTAIIGLLLLALVLRPFGIMLL